MARGKKQAAVTAQAKARHVRTTEDIASLKRHAVLQYEGGQLEKAIATCTAGVALSLNDANEIAEFLRRRAFFELKYLLSLRASGSSEPQQWQQQQQVWFEACKEDCDVLLSANAGDAVARTIRSLCLALQNQADAALADARLVPDLERVLRPTAGEATASIATQLQAVAGSYELDFADELATESHSGYASAVVRAVLSAAGPAEPSSTRTTGLPPPPPPPLVPLFALRAGAGRTFASVEDALRQAAGALTGHRLPLALSGAASALQSGLAGVAGAALAVVAAAALLQGRYADVLASVAAGLEAGSTQEPVLLVARAMAGYLLGSTSQALADLRAVGRLSPSPVVTAASFLQRAVSMTLAAVGGDDRRRALDAGPDPSSGGGGGAAPRPRPRPSTADVPLPPELSSAATLALLAAEVVVVEHVQRYADALLAPFYAETSALPAVSAAMGTDGSAGRTAAAPAAQSEPAAVPTAVLDALLAGMGYDPAERAAVLAGAEPASDTLSRSHWPPPPPSLLSAESSASASASGSGSVSGAVVEPGAALFDAWGPPPMPPLPPPAPAADDSRRAALQDLAALDTRYNERTMQPVDEDRDRAAFTPSLLRLLRRCSDQLGLSPSDLVTPLASALPYDQKRSGVGKPTTATGSGAAGLTAQSGPVTAPSASAAAAGTAKTRPPAAQLIESVVRSGVLIAAPPVPNPDASPTALPAPVPAVLQELADAQSVDEYFGRAREALAAAQRAAAAVSESMARATAHLGADALALLQAASAPARVPTPEPEPASILGSDPASLMQSGAPAVVAEAAAVAAAVSRAAEAAAAAAAAAVATASDAAEAVEARDAVTDADLPEGSVWDSLGSPASTVLTAPAPDEVVVVVQPVRVTGTDAPPAASAADGAVAVPALPAVAAAASAATAAGTVADAAQSLAAPPSATVPPAADSSLLQFVCAVMPMVRGSRQPRLDRIRPRTVYTYAAAPCVAVHEVSARATLPASYTTPAAEPLPWAARLTAQAQQAFPAHRILEPPRISEAEHECRLICAALEARSPEPPVHLVQAGVSVLFAVVLPLVQRYVYDVVDFTHLACVCRATYALYLQQQQRDHQAVQQQQQLQQIQLQQPQGTAGSDSADVGAGATSLNELLRPIITFSADRCPELNTCFLLFPFLLYFLRNPQLCANLRALVLPRWIDYDEVVTLAFLRQLSTLEHLVLPPPDLPDQADNATLALHYLDAEALWAPALTVPWPRSTNAGSLEEYLDQCSALRTLVLDSVNVAAGGAVYVRHPPPHLPRLEALWVGRSPPLHHATVMLLAQARTGQCPLTDLVLAGNTLVAEELLCAVAQSCALRRLWLPDMRSVTDKLILALAASPHATALQALCVSSPAVTDPAVGALLLKCTNLLSLSLSGCTALTSFTLLAMRAAPGLQVLALRGVHAVADVAVIRLVSRCPGLEALDLRGLPLLSDLSLSALAEHCGASLRRLLLPSVPNIGGQSVSELLRACTALVELRAPAFAAPALSAGRLESLALPRFVPTRAAIQGIAAQAHSLRQLNLSGSSGLDTASLQDILTPLRRLEQLVLDDCPLINDVGLLTVSLLAPQLHVLRARNLPEVTDASAVALAHRCTALRIVDLRGCPLLTERAHRHLSVLPHLVLLALQPVGSGERVRFCTGEYVDGQWIAQLTYGSLGM